MMWTVSREIRREEDERLGVHVTHVRRQGRKGASQGQRTREGAPPTIAALHLEAESGNRRRPSIAINLPCVAAMQRHANLSPPMKPASRVRGEVVAFVPPSRFRVFLQPNDHSLRVKSG